MILHNFVPCAKTAVLNRSLELALLMLIVLAVAANGLQMCFCRTAAAGNVFFARPFFWEEFHSLLLEVELIVHKIIFLVIIIKHR
jgi:hypothetical protein